MRTRSSRGPVSRGAFAADGAAGAGFIADVALGGLDFAARASAFVMRPSLPVPLMSEASNPLSRMTFAAAGIILTSPDAAADGDAAAGRAVAGAPLEAPARSVAIVCPTLATSPSATKCSPMTPASGATSSCAALSVSSSTIASSLATVSPGCFIQEAIVTSETLSPTFGTSIFMADAPDAGAADFAAGAAAGFAVAPLPAPRRAISFPISAFSPSATRISSKTPSAGETSSCAALSVSSSTNGSSFLTVSPTALNHCAMVTSLTLSPTFGIVISVICGPFWTKTFEYYLR